MKTDPISLAPTQLVKALDQQRQPDTQLPNHAEAASRRWVAKVVASQSLNAQNVELKLSFLPDNGQTPTSMQEALLSVISSKPLPVGSLLELTIDNKTQPPTLIVVNVTPPTGWSFLPSTPNTNANSGALNDVIKQWLASRLPHHALSQQPSESVVPKTQPTLNHAIANKLAAYQQHNANHTSRGTSTSSSVHDTVFTATQSKQWQALSNALQQLPADAQRPLNTWLEKLPSLAQLSQPNELQKRIQHSGILLEHQLHSHVKASLNTPSAAADSTANRALAWLANAVRPPAPSSYVEPSAATSTNTSTTATASGNSQAPRYSLSAPQPLILMRPSATADMRYLFQRIVDIQASLLQDPSLESDAIPPSSPSWAHATRAQLESSAHQHWQTHEPRWLTDVQQLNPKAALGRALLALLNNHLGKTPLDGINSATQLPLQWPQERQTSEASNAIRALLSHIEVEQFKHAQHDKPNWTLPLFWKDEHGVQEAQIHIEGEPEKDHTNARKKIRQWRIRLHFDLPNLGKLGIDIAISAHTDARDVEATFFSNQAHTLQQLNTKLMPLKARLEQLGVNVSDIHVRHGDLPVKSQPSIQQRLIDERT